MVIKVQRKEWRIIMDKIDKKLITLLQNNARMPLKALAAIIINNAKMPIAITIIIATIFAITFLKKLFIIFIIWGYVATFGHFVTWQ